MNEYARVYPDRHRVRLRILVVGFLLTVACSLSIHVMALNYLGIPFPSGLPSGWSRFPDRLLTVGGTVTMAALIARRRLFTFPLLCCIVFVLIATVNETLLRGPLMDIFPNSAWNLYPFIDALPSYLSFALLAIAATTAQRYLTSLPGRALALVAITAALYFWFKPWLADAFDPIRAWTAAHEGHALYSPPYDWHVQLPAYITFAEPVLGALAVSALVAPVLPRRQLLAGVALAALLFAMRGQFFTTFTYPFVASIPPVTAMLSFGQFCLESLALACMTAATWVVADERFDGVARIETDSTAPGMWSRRAAGANARRAI